MTITPPLTPAGATGGEPSVTVIIAAYTQERWDSIVAGVASVLSQSPPPLELILAIDHNQGLAERARKHLDGVTVVESTEPRGASGARNSGVKNSGGEILVFLDDDQYAAPGWLRSLCTHFSDPDVLGVGGGITLAWPQDRPRWFPREFDWAVGGSYRGMPEVAAPVRNVWSGNMAIRRSTFDTAGGFRPGFGKLENSSRPEDTDLCLRVLDAFPSGHWQYEPLAEVAHIVPPERSTRRFFLNRCWSEGRGKAALATMNGVDASTASERRYATRVLPGAFLRETARGICRADTGALERAVAILLGVLYTAAGFAVGCAFASWSQWVGNHRTGHAEDDGAASECDPPFHPVLVAQWDILNGFPTIDIDESANQCSRVNLLVRMATEPLGCVELEADNQDALAKEAAAQVQTFLPAVNTRLAASGVRQIDELPVDGLRLNPNELEFVAERNRLLENAPAVSVVVCTRDRPRQVAECVRQLDDQDYPNYEIIVVDNAPADAHAVPSELAKLELSVPVRYLVEPRAGTSRARNTGTRAAASEIIAFVDDDVVADPHWLAELLRGFSVRPHVGCVTGAVLPAELRTRPQLWFEEFGGFAKGRGYRQEVFGPGHPQSPLYPLPPFGAGANMAFRRDVLIDIGGFDVALGGGTPAKGSEDTYAFSRTLLAQHTLVYQPTALVWHFHRDTFSGLKNQLRGYGTATSAFYAALILHDPKLLIPLTRFIPAGIRDLRGKDSLRTASMRTFPTSILRAESRGLLLGFLTYVSTVITNKIGDPARAPWHWRRQ